MQAGEKNDQEYTEWYSVALPVKTVYLNAEKQKGKNTKTKIGLGGGNLIDI